MNNLVVKLDVTNTGDEKFMPVGPCDFECYLDLGETLKKVDNPWVKQQSRIVITKLRPNERLALEAKVVTGVGFDGGEFVPAHSYYGSSSDKEHLLTVEGRHREAPRETYRRSLFELQRRLMKVKDHFLLVQAQNKEAPGKDAKFEIEGENHTLGNPLAYVLNGFPEVEAAGYAMHHPFVEKIVVQIKAKKDAAKALVKAVDYLHNLFGKLRGPK
jgi:DNA-directed RNA polymerase subunit L